MAANLLVPPLSIEYAERKISCESARRNTLPCKQGIESVSQMGDSFFTRLRRWMSETSRRLRHESGRRRSLNSSSIQEVESLGDHSLATPTDSGRAALPCESLEAEQEQSTVTIRSQITEYLHARDTHFGEDDDQCIVVPVQGKTCSFQIRIVVEEDEQFVTVVAWSPIVIPEGSRPAVAETTCRLNEGLRVGRCEFHIDSGYLGVFLSQFVQDGAIDESFLSNMLSGIPWTLDLFVAATMSVVYGNELPADAVRWAKIGAGALPADGASDDDESEDREDLPGDDLPGNDLSGDDGP